MAFQVIQAGMQITSSGPLASEPYTPTGTDQDEWLLNERLNGREVDSDDSSDRANFDLANHTSND